MFSGIGRSPERNTPHLKAQKLAWLANPRALIHADQTARSWEKNLNRAICKQALKAKADQAIRVDPQPTHSAGNKRQRSPKLIFWVR